MRSNSLPLFEPESLSRPKFQSFSVQAHWLAKDDCRLDATFYADEAIAARGIVEDSGFEVKPLGDASVAKGMFWPSRFKRIYTNKPEDGYPFLQASEALMFRPLGERWLARSKFPDAENYFANENWILVSRSGVVGRCVIVGKRLKTFFISEDLIRIIAVIPSGYIYAFLSTWMGQALIKKEQYGMTITHLEPHHLERLPVPLLPLTKRQEIHEQITKAYRLRNEANDLLDEAEKLLYTELDLPHFDESKVAYLTKEDSEFERPRLKAFALRASELADRFDVSFHLPIAKASVEQMNKGKYPSVRLGSKADVRLPGRFKRIYVEREYGVPFLQGSHIPLMKPYDLKYLSKRANEKHIEECLIHSGWILLTRSGAVGRPLLVTSRLEGWAASEHCLRLIPQRSASHAGFIVAFLLTPYGQHQLASKIYGGVVDELTEEDTAAVWLPDAPVKLQEKIGKLVVEAFEKKEEANEIENEAIKNLEDILIQGKG